MKKLTQLGCLLALVFAGASAFADSWFNGFSGNDPIAEGDASWTVPDDTDTKWYFKDNVWNLNDWDHGAVYTAATARVVSEADSKITTTVTFTAMDPEDLSSYSIADAKAGVTLVELAENNYQFKVIQFDSVGNTNRWVDVVCDSTLTAIPGAIPVTVEIFKSDDVAKVKYTIGDIASVNESPIGVSVADATIRSVEYKGQCKITPDLIGLAWSNDPTVPTEITITPPTGYVGPTTIKYNHGDIKARFAERGKGENADSDDAVIAYMTGMQDNGQFGWVNYALGQDDDANVGIQSNKTEIVENEVKLSFDFGFVVDENYEVAYSIDNGEATVSPTTGVHTVSVTVKEKNGTDTYAVTDQVVGVMQAESPASEGKATGTKVYEIVAVPWEAFGHTDVTVENLLVTSLLTAGDTLYVWNDEGQGHYDTYKLTDGVWVAQTQTFYSSQTGAQKNTSKDPAENELVQGTAVWIEHDVASKIVFTGMLKDDSKASKVETIVYGSKDEDIWTLVANPSIKAFNLAGITNAAEGDRVVIEDAADPREYEYKDGAWGYDKKVVIEYRSVRGQKIPVYKTSWTVADKIPAGIGFWYVRKANSAVAKDEDNNITITFGDNNVTE